MKKAFPSNLEEGFFERFFMEKWRCCFEIKQELEMFFTQKKNFPSSFASPFFDSCLRECNHYQVRRSYLEGAFALVGFDRCILGDRRRRTFSIHREAVNLF